MTSNHDLFRRAQDVIPGGVNSPVRAFRSVGGTPYFVSRGAGARVWDVEGNEYLDLVQSYGAIIAGHAHPRIVEAVRSAAGDGTSFGAPTEREVLLAEAISERVTSCEKVRLVSSGTEATMAAVRLARAATGRDRVVKFAGNYHGHSDALLVDSGSSVAHIDPEAGVPGSLGVPVAAVADTAVAVYNRVPALDEGVACVIVEPVAANMGLVPPEDGFLEGLRRECDRVGALLVFDEVITGFRLERGGAQARYSVRPDLTCFGKVIGGGLNIGAFGGRSEVMDLLAPLGGVYQAGTLSGNPLATAAGLAALDLLDDHAYATLGRSAERLAEGLAGALDEAGIASTIVRVGPLVGMHLAGEPARNFEEARRTDEQMYGNLFHALLDRGVAVAPGAYEVMFPGLAHDDALVDEIVERAGDAAASVAERFLR